MSLLALAACSAPEFTYVKNDADKVYLKVPRDWSQVDQDQLSQMELPVDPDSATAAALRDLTWSRGFDADPNVNANHMLFGESEQPFVYFTVRHLTDSQRNAASLDTLRDFILPVTDASRVAAVEQALPLAGFELLYDEVLTQPGLHGVRVIFNYRIQEGLLQTFDLTAYLNGDNSVLYLVLVRCTANCYRERFDELNAVSSSLTIRT